MALRSIYQHTDYRAFLKEFYEEKKRLSPTYSYRSFAAKAGLNSPNYLKLVTTGQRNLTVTNIHSFARALGLSGDELGYFESLVLFNQADSPAERAYYKKRLASSRVAKPGTQARLSGEKELVSHRLFPALLLALIGLTEKDAAAAVAKRLGLEASFVEDAIAALTRRGIVALRAGVYAVNFEHYVFHDPMPNRLQKKFLREQLELSLEAFDKVYGDKAKFFAHTFTVGADDFAACIDDVRAFMEELTNKYDASAPELLVQLNLQLFQVTRQLLTKS